jgi:HlyD family secretion protein
MPDLDPILTTKSAAPAKSSVPPASSARASAAASGPASSPATPPASPPQPSATASPPSARWRRWLWLTLGVLVVGAASLRWGVPLLLGPRVQVVVVRSAEIVQTVVASGRVASPARISIGSQILGQVVAVPVLEGQVVATGQTLITLDEGDVRAVLVQARTAVAQADARFTQLAELTLPVAEQALANAEANHDNVQHQFDRAKELVGSGANSQSQLDDAERNLRIADGERETARLRLLAIRPGGVDHVLAQGDQAQARATLQVAEASFGHTAIRAPVAGTLLTRHVERGDVVQPGAVLMELSPVGKMQLVVQIDEKNLRHLALGQPALAAADAYPERRFTAALVYVNPSIDPSRGSVEVKLDVLEPPDILRQDMTVSVDIEVARIVAAACLPAEAVHEPNGASPWVMVVVAGRTERRPVRLGVRGTTFVEVVSGVLAGDLVVPTTTAALAPGRRVRTSVLP